MSVLARSCVVLVAVTAVFAAAAAGQISSSRTHEHRVSAADEPQFAHITSMAAQTPTSLEIVPDVVPLAHTSVELTIAFGNHVVAMGNELTPTQVKHQPSVEFKASEGEFYTLIMTDPDAPSRAEPTYREWHHWIVANIPGNSVSEGETLSEYVSSAPPKGSGLHRYVFLLYKQPKKLHFTEPKLTNTSMEGRGKFSAKAFASKYGLGDPVGVQCYQAQYDDYVPHVYKMLSGEGHK